MARSHFITRRHSPSLPVLVAGYIGAQLMLRALSELKPQFAAFALVASIATLVSLIAVLAYLRADKAVVAGVVLGLAESVAHLSTDVTTHLLSRSERQAVIRTVLESLPEFMIRWSALSLALSALVWCLRRMRPGDSSRDEESRRAA
jgi:hypothetical protein